MAVIKCRVPRVPFSGTGKVEASRDKMSLELKDIAKGMGILAAQQGISDGSWDPYRIHI